MKPSAASLVMIVLLAVLLVWCGAALVRVENERYALTIGMCSQPPPVLPDVVCLKKVQTRTGWWWHIFYALTG